MNKIKKEKKIAWLTRPFEERDMAPVPPGWIIGPPAFVGIASGKAGTSWWYKLLMEHPSVKPNRLNSKELTYFNHFGYNGIESQQIETYRHAFAAPKGCISGEWSPSYLNFPLAINYLANTAPETKILAIVRNPVDRILSAQNQQLVKRIKILNLKDDRSNIFKTFSVFPNVFLNTFLYMPFKQLLKLFKRSQILILQYEKCKQYPEREIEKTYHFLNIDEHFIPPGLNESVNRIPYSIPPFSKNARKLIAEYFLDDVNYFKKLFPEIDISLWKDFNE